MLKSFSIPFVLGLAVVSQSPVLMAEQATVAVASNFGATLDALVAEFQGQSHHRIQVIRGSSGRFVAQISNGAPIDIFLSADQVKPQALEAGGFAVASSRFTYAIGRLVLWSTDAELIDARGSVLRTDEFNRLAIANPALAPYGAAAIEVLNSLDVRAQTEDRIVQGENIAQTYQFVSTANAEMGFVALSQVFPQLKSSPFVQRDPGMEKELDLTQGSGWLVPETLHNPIRQDAILLTRAIGNPAAQSFMNFLQSPGASAIVSSAGYRVRD